MTARAAARDDPAAMWIPTPSGHLFAWYHPPAVGTNRRCAVLLVDPFGVDRMVLHLTYRRLALRLAELGFAVLRVDHPGTCDSEGSPREHARIDAWMCGLDAAADRLRRWSGAGELSVCGLLLGGTLAAMLAARRNDVTAMVLWAPYVLGRAAVRASVAATATCRSNPEGREPSSAADGDQEALGFLLSRELIEDLHSVDLLRTTPVAVRHALLVSRGPCAPESKLVPHLAAARIAVDVQNRPHDDIEDLLQAAGQGDPRTTIEEIADWHSRMFPREAGVAPAGRPVLDPSEVVLTEAGGIRVRESAVWLGTDGGVFAIASEPADGAVREPAVVLVNGGANHRPGINRSHTEWARLLAGRGHRVLRIDIRGLGDSPPSRPELQGVLYLDETRQDVLDAAGWLRERGAQTVCAVGLCAGGYQAYHAALAGSAIDAIVLLNPLRFHEERLGAANLDLAGGARWRSALHQAVRPHDLLRAGPRLARKILRRFGPEAMAARRLRGCLLDLTERGVDVAVVYNQNEPAFEYLRSVIHPVRRRLEATGAFRIEMVGHADHIFSPLWVQERVTDVILHHVGALAARTLAEQRTPKSRRRGAAAGRSAG